MDINELSLKFRMAPSYLSEILFIGRENGGMVPNTHLAKNLGVSSPAVSQAVVRLKKLGLVSQPRYKTIVLTRKGKILAEAVIRRHFLLEHLLVGQLGYPWDKSDAEAKNIQTTLSDELTEHLFRKLGRPQLCPHGNPLPGSPVEESYLGAPALTEADPETTIKIIRITEKGEGTEGMLSFCQAKGVLPGVICTVGKKKKQGFVCLKNGKKILIPNEYASCIRWSKP